MPKTSRSLRNRINDQKLYDRANEHLYSENVNYLNPPDGYVKPFPNHKQFPLDSDTDPLTNDQLYGIGDTELDCVGNLGQLPDENTFAFAHKRNATSDFRIRVVNFDTGHKVEQFRNDDDPKYTIGNNIDTEASTCASDGEAVYFADPSPENNDGELGKPQRVGKVPFKQFWDLTQSTEKYVVGDAEIKAPELDAIRIFVDKFSYGRMEGGSRTEKFL